MALLGFLLVLLQTTILSPHISLANEIDLSDATIVVRSADLSNAEQMAAVVLVEEIEARTGIRLRTSISWPEGGPVIAVFAQSPPPAWNRRPLQRQEDDFPRRIPLLLRFRR